MGRTAAAAPPLRPPSHFPPARPIGVEPTRALLKQLLLLSVPVLAENMLHMLVGINDTYLANHVVRPAAGMSAEALRRLHEANAAAAAAVGTITYVLWFVGLIIGSVGTGTTALIARATGARHRSLANAVCAQSVAAAVAGGVLLGVLMFALASPLAHASGLKGQAHEFALAYLRVLAVAMPFTSLMFIANNCLRGAGDTVTPAVVMIVVDVVNMGFTFALTYGLAGFPRMGFEGIAAGTVIAYVAGGVIQAAVLLRGRGGVRLFVHRVRPHWHTLKRVLRVGLPSGAEGLLQWLANFGVVIVVNTLDPTNAMAAAHVNAIRIEAVSYMAGLAVATAAATMVGQSLGMNDPRRATRAAYLAYAVGGGMMALCGVAFVTLGGYPARWMADDEHVAALTTRCLFITGFIQPAFASAAVFGGVLRGAGDTLAVMLLNLASVLGIRLVGVLVVGQWLKLGLGAVWVVLAAELAVRGILAYARFLNGAWRRIEV